MCRVSDAGPLAIYEPVLRDGVRRPRGKEPAVGGVAVYGDLAAERLGRVMRWAAERTVADARQRSERRRCGLQEGDFGEIGGIARMFSGHAATGLDEMVVRIAGWQMYL
jgi:hypothetical protein